MPLRGGYRVVLPILVVAAAVVAVGLFWLMRSDSEVAPKRRLVSAPQTDTSSPSADPIPPDTVPSEAPTATPQATGLKREGLTETTRSKHGQKGVPGDAGGCDFHYGEPTQCVPTVFPDGIEEFADKCLWLKLN